MGKSGLPPRACNSSGLRRLSCSRCLWRGLVIAAFTLFLVAVLVAVLGLTGGDPASPGVFAVLAAGFLIFAIAGPAFIDRMSAGD